MSRLRLQLPYLITLYYKTKQGLILAQNKTQIHSILYETAISFQNRNFSLTLYMVK